MVGFGVLGFVVLQHHYSAGGQVIGVGLALTAYTLGLRHGFDADHLAATDTVVRKLTAQRRPAGSVGFWFALGHSTVVMGMAVLVAAGAAVTTVLIDDTSGANFALGVIGVAVSGAFLLLLGAVNVIATRRLWQMWRRRDVQPVDGAALDRVLDGRGVLSRLLQPVLRRVNRPWHMYPVGLLFGLGFDTATSVALLVMTGAGAVTGLPWWVVLMLPVLFTAGMTLVDGTNGAMMNTLYTAAADQPARRLAFNLAATGTSTVLALTIGVLQIASLAGELGAADPVTGFLTSIPTGYVGFLVVAGFAAVYAGAWLSWRRSVRPAQPTPS